jgi:hypothetical protein
MAATIDASTLPISLPAAADLTSKLFRFGKHTSTGIAVCSVAGERADGIIGSHYKTTPVVGDAVDLFIDRMPLIESGASYSAGANLTTDASGRAVAAGAGDVVNAVAIDAATAASQYVRVRPVFQAAFAQNVADASVDPAETRLAGPGLIVIDLPDAATATYEYVNAEKIEIIDVWAIKDGAGAANTVQVTDSADAAITNAMAFAVDKTRTGAGTIDVATRVLAAGAGFKVVNTRAAGSSAGQLFILAIKRA